MIGTTEKQTQPILTENQKKLFVKYYPVIAKIVNSMRGKLPTFADIDELHSAGVMGLADAIPKLDPTKEKTFAGYVSTRIRGAIIDQLRSLDYMSRSARSDAKNIDKIKESLEQKLGRTPTPTEIRLELGVNKKQFDKIMRRTQPYSFFSINNSPENSNTNIPSFAETIADDSVETASETIEKREIAQEVRDNIASLPDKQRQVLENYYFKEKKLGEIAKEFGLTEARICQIHAQALSTLRARFAN